MLRMEQRTDNAKGKLTSAERRLRLEQRRGVEEERRTHHLRAQAVGKIVLSYFPALNEVKLGDTMAQTLEDLGIVSIFLETLFQPKYEKMLRQLQYEANQNYIDRTRSESSSQRSPVS